MNELPTAPFKRIMKKYAPLVSADAVNTFQAEIENYAHDLAEQAAKAAKQGNRKTVQPEDIEFVLKL